MNFLLDTCTILWLQLEPSRVPASLRQILLKPETRRYASAAVAWEIAIKWSLGKLPLPVTPQEFMRRLRTESLVESLSIDEASALQVAKLPGLPVRPHSDLSVHRTQPDPRNSGPADPPVCRPDHVGLTPAIGYLLRQRVPHRRKFQHESRDRSLSRHGRQAAARLGLEAGPIK
jgi:PIN domain nuclease of toxin-antitoxin system